VSRVTAGISEVVGWGAFAQKPNVDFAGIRAADWPAAESRGRKHAL